MNELNGLNELGARIHKSTYLHLFQFIQVAAVLAELFKSNMVDITMFCIQSNLFHLGTSQVMQGCTLA